MTYLSFKPCCEKLQVSLQDTILSNPGYNGFEGKKQITGAFDESRNEVCGENGRKQSEIITEEKSL